MWCLLAILGVLILIVANGQPRDGRRGYSPRADGPKTPPTGGSAVRPRRRPY